MRRQLAHGLQLRGVYTFASNLDDGSAWNTSVSANTPAFVIPGQFPARLWAGGDNLALKYVLADRMCPLGAVQRR